MLIYIMFIISTILVFVILILETGYPKYGWFKKICHDKLGIHVPDLKNRLDYDEDKKIVYSTCKYCDEEMIYIGICKYLVTHDVHKIPGSVYNIYCKECISNDYTQNRGCCPNVCKEFGVCEMCRK